MLQKIKHKNSVIQYNWIKSDRIKTSQITVTSNNITVRTPKTKSASDVKNIIKRKIQWILTKQLYYAIPDKSSSALNSTLLICGKDYKVCIIHSSEEKTILIGDTIEFHIKQKRHTNKLILERYNSYLIKRANLLFSKMVKELSQEMGISGITLVIKPLKDRWGSATKNGIINLNFNLIKAPKNVIKYVILHELCHFKIKDHSFRFWKLLSTYMSDYEESIEWLKLNRIRII